MPDSSSAPSDPSPTAATGTLHTCSDIAVKLGYSASSIWRAILRLGFRADETTAGGLKLYRESRLPDLQSKLQPSRRH